MAVTKCLGLSGICFVSEILSFVFNGLMLCLKNRQVGERGRKQGEFGSSENFSAMLSTESGDSFALAPDRVSLQPTRRINEFKSGVSAWAR
jgi:hypothetical protein